MGIFGREVASSNTYTFAGHQTFALRSGWLKKGYDALRSDGENAFMKENAIVTLGVGKNMVTSIRHWMMVTGMAAENKEHGKAHGLKTTALADYIFADDGLDPYLERDVTLWLIHERLCSTECTSFTWFYSFHRWRRPDIYRDKLTEAILHAAQLFPRSPSRETIARDVDCFIHTYVGGRSASEDSIDSPLTTLGLIVPDHDQGYRFSIGAKPRLSPAVFAWALSRFWKRHRADAETVSVVEIMYDEGAPGVLFKLDEESVLSYLDALEEVTDGALRFENTVQAQQVIRLASEFDEAALLEACYAQ